MAKLPICVKTRDFISYFLEINIKKYSILNGRVTKKKGISKFVS